MIRLARLVSANALVTGMLWCADNPAGPTAKSVANGPPIQELALLAIQRTQQFLLTGLGVVTILSLFGLLVSVWLDGPPSVQGNMGGLGGRGGGWKISPALMYLIISISFAALLTTVGVYGISSVVGIVQPELKKQDAAKNGTKADSDPSKPDVAVKTRPGE